MFFLCFYCCTYFFLFLFVESILSFSRWLFERFIIDYIMDIKSLFHKWKKCTDDKSDWASNYATSLLFLLDVTLICVQRRGGNCYWLYHRLVTGVMDEANDDRLLLFYRFCYFIALPNTVRIKIWKWNLVKWQSIYCHKNR
jgi:hypothetical protein